MLRIEQVFVRGGVQAPLLVPDGVPCVRFELHGGGHVEMSFAAAVDVKRGRAGWAKFDGGSAGALYGVSALRAVGAEEGRLMAVFDEHSEQIKWEVAA